MKNINQSDLEVLLGSAAVYFMRRDNTYNLLFPEDGKPNQDKLRRAFVWQFTPQGGEFWASFELNYQEGGKKEAQLWKEITRCFRPKSFVLLEDLL